MIRRQRADRACHTRFLIGCISLLGFSVMGFLSGCKPTPSVTPRRVSRPADDGAELRRIRVLLLSGVPSFELAVHGRYVITDTQGRRIGTSTGGLRLSTVRAGLWQPPSIELGGHRYVGRELRIVPAKSGALELVIAGPNGPQSRRYRGELRCHLLGDGTMDVVNALDIEAYLTGVLPGELYGKFHLETFRAQAIASRTYALYQKVTGPADRYWDVLSTPDSQVYVGMSSETSRAIEAVESTRGIVCTWHSRAGEKIFCTYFSSTCGGVTQDAANVKSYRSFPRPDPLAGGVRCSYCRQAPHYTWPAVRMSKQEITERLVARYPTLAGLGTVERLEVIERTRHGRPRRIAVVGTTGRREELRSEDVRLCLGPMTVKSTNCRITTEGTDVVFSDGRGWGHGMGMCQWGAEGLARLGGTADDIIKFYYPNSRFDKAYQ